MMDFIDDLRKDHTDIIRILLSVRQRLDSIANESKEWSEQIETVKSLMVKFHTEIVHSHFPKEELILFPELEMIGVSVKHGPIELLLREHQQITYSLDKLSRHTHGTVLLDPGARNAASGQLTAFIRLVESHAKKEESALYEIAKRHISEERLEEMYRAIQ